MTIEIQNVGTYLTERLTLEGSRVGWAAIDAGDYVTAFTFFEPWKADPIGQYFLGEIYLKDPKFQKVKRKGIELLKLSAETNFAWVFLALGNYYATRSRGKKDRQHAIYWHTKSANRWHAVILANIALDCAIARLRILQMERNGFFYPQRQDTLTPGNGLLKRSKWHLLSNYKRVSLPHVRG